jgi:hypothetical protein
LIDGALYLCGAYATEHTGDCSVTRAIADSRHVSSSISTLKNDGLGSGDFECDVCDVAGRDRGATVRTEPAASQ